MTADKPTATTEPPWGWGSKVGFTLEQLLKARDAMERAKVKLQRIVSTEALRDDHDD